MKTKHFFLAIAFATIAFTFFACSSGDPDDEGKNEPSSPSSVLSSSSGVTQSSSDHENSGGSNLSDLPTQVYLAGYDDNHNLIAQEEYKGKGDVFALFSKYKGHTCICNGYKTDCECECTGHDDVVFSCEYEDIYDTLQAGNIQNGKIVLDLPKNIDSKYLNNMEPCNSENCESTFSVVPKDVTGARASSSYAIIPGKSNCSIDPYLIKSGKATGRAQFLYFSESGKATGTETRTSYEDGYSETEQTNFDMNFSKGWNLVYYDYHDNSNVTLTTDLSKGGTLEWWLRCSDDD